LPSATPHDRRRQLRPEVECAGLGEVGTLGGDAADDILRTEVRSEAMIVVCNLGEMPMDPEFAKLTESLMPLCEALRAMSPSHNIPRKEKIKGVYLFSEGHKHLYVGRSNNIRRRFKEHVSPGSRINDAPFAVLLARESTGILPAYSGKNVRMKLALNEAFATAFSKAKVRISSMEFRFVEEGDPVRQTLLEVYCAVVLATRYNKFEVT
jgi:hypothetical protein